MAIIKCPECGHQTSDKAPICPSCGVEIAGKITRCSYCGEIYFKSDVVCPHCHKTSDSAEKSSSPQSDQLSDSSNLNDKEPADTGLSAPQQRNLQTQPGSYVKETDMPATNKENNNPIDNKRNNKTTLIISLIIALLALGICFYFYNKAQNDKEQEEYEFALKSDDPMILQAYLNNFKDAPQAHIDSINNHLQRLAQLDQDWTNALINGSKSALTEYLKIHPESPHRQEALDKIDSIDWAQNSKINTEEAYQAYIDSHPDGNHYEDAMIALKKIKANEVTLDEKQTVSNILRKFFISINTKDEEGLTSTVSAYVNFLGKTGATKSDIVSFMNKLYKDDIKNIIWSIPGGYDIKKKEIGDEQYEYSVSFMADQKVEKTDNTNTTNKFRINAKVNPDGKITDMSMTKIVE